MESFNYFEDLTHSLVTARLLLEKAHDNESAIEGLCLYVSIIDGFLRLSIIYSRTQKSSDHTYGFEKQMIRQDDHEKTYSEKEIYQMAFRENIISDKLYQQLKQMYQFRNKVVHRFNISAINYTQIADACTKFESVYQEIFNIVAFLEHGPHGIPKPSPEDIQRFHKKAFKKITGKNLDEIVKKKNNFI